MRAVWKGLGLVLGLATAGHAAAACQLRVVSEYHITMDGNEPLVDASINGRPVRFLIDMGSSLTMLSPSGAARLGLRVHRLYNMRFTGVGGGEEPNEANIAELKIGNSVSKNVDVAVVGRNLTSESYVGLMGQDVLSQADIEFDFGAGAMRIFKPKDCDGDQVVYWGKAYSLATIAPSNDPNTLNVYVTLNGHQIVAQVESGSPTSILTTALAERVGVTPTTTEIREVDPTVGISGKPVRTREAVFSTLSVGDEQIKNAKLRMAELFAADGLTIVGSLIPDGGNFPQMLLGADFIRAHRIYVARSQGKIYFSYNGGPIFQTIAPSTSEQAAAPASSSPVKP